LIADHDPGGLSTPDTAARLSLRLPATRASVDAARIAVLDYLAPSSLAARTIFDVELVLEEVLMNVVTHGNPDGEEGMAGHCVELTVESTPDGVRMVFEDDGIAFDPTAATSPPRPATLADAEPGGLGIGLVRRRSSALAYARSDGRNVLTVEIART
jgi:sigma-B regulation protein RsbU (phosphoserine phosphatase)